MAFSGNMPKVNSILHLTDIHVGANYAFDQSVLVDGLIRDLEIHRDTLFKPEYLCLSGDLAFTGIDNNYSDALEIILKVAETCNLGYEKIIVAPGNHDLDTEVVASKSRELGSIRQRIKLRENADELITNSTWTNYFNDAFGPFTDLNSLLSDNRELDDWPFYRVQNFDDISFVSINTALISGTGLPGLDDQENLYFPEEKLSNALKKTTLGNSVVVVGHHPLDWFSAANKTRIKSTLNSHQASYFYGHVHEPNPVKVTTSNGSMFISQGGALCQGRERNIWAGYTIALHSKEKGTWLTKTRKWFENRRVFDDALELGHRGEFSSEPSIWKSLLPNLDYVAIDNWRLKDLLPNLKETIGETVLGEALENVFVAPEFAYERQVSGKQNLTFGPRQASLKFEELVDVNDNFLIKAKQETGKTTTLNRLALEIAAKQIKDQCWKIPVKIEFGAFDKDLNNLKRTIKKSIITLPPNWSFEKLLEAGRFVILVDDFDFNDKTRKYLISEFIKKYPICRYVFTTSTPIYDNVGLRPEISETQELRTISLKPFRASGLTALIQSSNPNKLISNNALRERIIREAEALNVPLTAVTSTFLIQIFCSETVERPMNQAALIERYLELLLEKYSKSEFDLAKFNFKNKADLLSALSEDMVKKDRTFLDEVAVINFISSYLTHYGLTFSAVDIFNHLIDARVLQLSSGMVSFRLRMFFEYFVANRMSTESSFCDYIFESNRYVTFPNEIALYCALNLKDEGRITKILNEYLNSFDTAWGAKKPEERGGKALDNFSLPIDDEDLQNDEDFSLKEQEESSINADHSSMLESIELPDRDDQSVSRHLPEDDLSNWIAHLILLGGMLKHLELIPNEVKISVLNKVLDGWLHFTHYSLSAVAEIARHRRLTINNVTYKSTLPESLAEIDVARLLMTVMPVAVSKMAVQTMGTEKLSQQIRNGILEKNGSPSDNLLRYSILVDVSLNSITELGEIVLEKVKGSNLLARAFSIKLHEMAIRYNLSGKQLEKCRLLTAEAALSVLNISKKQKVRQRNRIIEGIKRERLLMNYNSNED